MSLSKGQLLGLALAALGLGLLLQGHDAIAQARNPFNVGITEGGAPGNGLVAWLLARQIEFERMMSAAVRAVRTSPGALWSLAGISFAYGVFHAAGPGHGKAVVASYMLANERALKRGLIISVLAALLQGIVAIAIVGGLAWVLNATAQVMRDTAHLVELASFAGIMLLGLWLTWRKGSAFLEEWRRSRKQTVPSISSRFACEACDGDEQHEHGPNCGHFHMPDPRQLGDTFSWRDAALTIVTAGSRPCSGAILVLVFAMAQGIFYAGVLATFAMAAGTAITTGALAAIAVLAKDLALRFTGEGGGRRVLIARGAELAAALLVFLLGLALLLGYSAAGI